MNFPKALFLGILSVIIGVLGDLVASILQGSLTLPTTQFRLFAIIAGIFIFLLVAVSIEQSTNKKKSQPEIKSLSLDLKKLRYELIQLREYRNAGGLWTQKEVDRWQELQRSLHETKLSLESLDHKVPEHEIDYYPPPPLGNMQKFIEFLKGAGVFIIAFLSIVSALFLTPASHSAYTTYFATVTPQPRPTFEITITPSSSTPLPVDIPEVSPTEMPTFTLEPVIEPSEEPLLEVPPTQATPILLPPGTSTAESCGLPPDNWVEYSIQSGDTLFDIAETTGTTVEVLQTTNCLDTTVLEIDQIIWVPETPQGP